MTTGSSPPIEQLEPRTYLTVQLAANVNTDTFSSNPVDFVTLGNQGLFFASQPDGNYALWKTDGTAAGSMLVKGGFSPRLVGSENGFSPITVGGKVYFQYAPTGTAFQLWVTDGTTQGTQFLATVKPGFNGGSSFPTQFVSFGGRVFFNATDSASGTELWSTDGTPAGTSLFFDLVPGATSSNVQALTVAGQYLFFETIESNVTSLWRSDGTVQNTIRLAQVTPTSQSGIASANGKVYFAAAVPGNFPDQIWESDGTVDGTRMLKDLSSANNAVLREFTIMGGNLYFTARTDASSTATLWRSDFTVTGTVPVVVNPPSGFSPNRLRASSNQLFFNGSDPTAGPELWRSDGTDAGTYRLADIRPGTLSSAPSSPVLTDAGAYFFANDGATGAELYFSDGGNAANSTYRVKDIYPGSTSSYNMTQGTVLSDGRLLFGANDPAVGYEPHVSDATSAGTHPLIDIETRDASSNPAELIDAGGVPLIAATPPIALQNPAQNNLQKSLWGVDPAGGGPTYLGAAYPSTDETTPVTGRGTYESVTFKGNTYFYSVFSGANSHLYRTDGTPAGTQSFLTFVPVWPNNTYAHFRHIAVLGDRLYFTGPDNQASSGISLYRTDGTLGGTEELLHAPSRITNLTAAGDTLYFSVDTKLGKIRNSDASPELFAETGQPVIDLKFASGQVIFTNTNSGAGGLVLRSSDGSSANLSSTLVSVSSDLIVFKDKVYFLSGTALCRSDGTPDGTRLVRAGTNGSPIVGWNRTVVGDYLYFVGTDSDHGSEWWRTDGTDAGTSLFADAVPGVAGSDPTVLLDQTDVARSIASWRGSIYFTAQTAAQGAELWRADPSGGAPILVSDLYPGATGSDPTSLKVIGDNLYFIAARPDIGRELFRVVDDVAPRVTAAAFAPGGNTGGTIRLALSEAVSFPAGGPAPSLTRLTGKAGTAASTSGGVTTAYDAATGILTITPAFSLSDGDYRLTIPVSWLADAAGNPMLTDFTFDFFVLAGDANHDRAVDFNDLLKLAQNYNTSGGKTYADADFTGDGNVDFNDLVILAQHYNTTLPAPGAALPVVSPAASFAADWAQATASHTAPTAAEIDPKKAKPKPIFSITPVVKPIPAKKAPPQRRK